MKCWCYMDELEHLIASKCCQMQRVKYHIIPFTWKVQNRPLPRDRKQICVSWSLGAEENGEGLPMGTEVPFGVMKMCRKQVEVTVTPHCERTKCHQIALFITVDSVVCEFHSNLQNKTKINSFQTAGQFNSTAYAPVPETPMSGGPPSTPGCPCRPGISSLGKTHALPPSPDVHRARGSKQPAAPGFVGEASHTEYR